MTVVGSIAYVAAGHTGVRAVAVSDPAQPVELAVYDTPGAVYSVAVEGATAYAADGDCGLLILETALAPGRLHLARWKQQWGYAARPGIYKVASSVVVHNQDHAAAGGVTVSGQWTPPDGSLLLATAVTNEKGQARFVIKIGQAGTFGFCVTGMEKAGTVYEPAANEVPACRSIEVGPLLSPIP